MKTIIAGSRNITDYELVKRTIEKSGMDITEVVSGGCRGVDTLGEQWAKENNIPIISFPANWTKNGMSAGPIRNTEMASYVGKNGGLILIWDGKSSGSNDMLNKAIMRQIKVFECIVT